MPKKKKGAISWAEESNQIFNKSLQKYLHPQFRAGLRVAQPQNPEEGSALALFGGAYKKENGVFHLGDIFIRDTELDNLKNKGFKLSLQHELTHLLYGLAHQGEKRPSRFPVTAWSLMSFTLARPGAQLFAGLLDMKILANIVEYTKKVIQNPDTKLSQFNSELVSYITNNITAENAEQAIDCLKHTVINEYEARISELLGSSTQKANLDSNRRAHLALEARLLQEWAEIMAKEIKKYRQDFTLPEMEKLSDVIKFN
jgi:xanthosine utilization system XapX-like protein